MLLSDEEISQISLSAVTVKDATEDVRAIEAAILAKLASAELPEPAYRCEPYSSVPNAIVSSPADYYTADQLRQAYAQGVAAQLAEKPSGYLSQYNLEMLQQGYPQTIVMLEGAKRDVPLYTRREAK